jgi:hypothetical protein
LLLPPAAPGGPRPHPERDESRAAGVVPGLRATASRQRRRRRRRRLLQFPPSCPDGGGRIRPEPGLPSSSREVVDLLLRTSTYAATVPGLGAMDSILTGRLVESLSGMLVGDANVSPSSERMRQQGMDRTGFARGQGEVIVLRTQFPYDDSPPARLSAYDEFVTRAFVILRNPTRSIPCHFDRMYAMGGHHPTGGSPSWANDDDGSATTMARNAWMRWRDDNLPDQLRRYESFVSFWMDRHEGRHDERLYFSYEGLVDGLVGPTEASRLVKFLEGGVMSNIATGHSSGGDSRTTESTIAIANAVVGSSFADAEEVPCIWEDVVGTTMTDESVVLGKSSSVHRRPFTAENIADVSGMLSSLIERYSGHKRLVGILSEYRREKISELMEN